MTMYRADQVGSLLRPPELLEAHAAYEQGRLPEASLRQLEDDAILRAIDLQRQTGIDILSDGEYRRATWAGDFTDAVDGYVPGEAPVRLVWRGQVTDATPAEVTTTGGRVVG